MKRSLQLAAFTLAALACTAPSALRAQETKASFTVDAAKAKEGAKLFNTRSCYVCHTVGKGKLAGPDLAGVLDRRDAEWLHKWLANTSEMLASDPIAQELLKENRGVKMPNVKLSAAEIDAVLNYIAQESAKVKK
jgi:mono/diheme cytochrome c family protein